MLFGTIMLSSLPTLEALAENSRPIDPDQKYAWSSNAGWLNFRPEPSFLAEMVKIYPDHLEGYVWGEKIGWIELGSYSDGEEHTYQNDSRDNWGVNNDGSGKLSGYAWSTNVGWVNFNPECYDCPTSVTINPTTGDFEGYVWSTTVGWINFQSSISGLALTTPPYSNGGANIDHKTGEPVPATNASTNTDSNGSHTMRNGAHVISLMSGQTMSNINFGNRPIPPTPTIIRGMKWHDINGDGKIDSDEPGLAGVTIFLDLNDNGVFEANEPSRDTNEQGQYVFSNLEAGTYVVREVVPTGYQQTYPPVLR